MMELLYTRSIWDTCLFFDFVCILAEETSSFFHTSSWEEPSCVCARGMHVCLHTHKYTWCTYIYYIFYWSQAGPQFTNNKTYSTLYHKFHRADGFAWNALLAFPNSYPQPTYGCNGQVLVILVYITKKDAKVKQWKCIGTLLIWPKWVSIICWFRQWFFKSWKNIF